MKIQLRNVSMTADLAAFLRRMDWHAEVLRPGLIEAEPPDEKVAAVAAAVDVEIDAYLRVWAAIHPDSPAAPLHLDPSAR